MHLPRLPGNFYGAKRKYSDAYHLPEGNIYYTDSLCWDYKKYLTPTGVDKTRNFQVPAAEVARHFTSQYKLTIPSRECHSHLENIFLSTIAFQTQTTTEASFRNMNPIPFSQLVCLRKQRALCLRNSRNVRGPQEIHSFFFFFFVKRAQRNVPSRKALAQANPRRKEEHKFGLFCGLESLLHEFLCPCIERIKRAKFFQSHYNSLLQQANHPVQSSLENLTSADNGNQRCTRTHCK